MLYAEVYDPASVKHREALSFIEPSNRAAYVVALRMAVRAKIYSALLKSEYALLQSILDMDLSLPDIIKKLSETLGDNMNHSLADIPIYPHFIRDHEWKQVGICQDPIQDL